MKEQLLIGAGSIIRSLCTAALFGTVVFAVSCKEDDPNAERGEFIRVYADPGDEEPADIGYVDVRGGESYVYVKSNVDYEVYWQDSEKTPWIEVVDRQDNYKSGFDRITLNVSPRSDHSYYTRRGGTLMFSSPANKLGKFITVYQGALARVSQDFTWLTYGNASPFITEGEKPYSGWTDVQKNNGWLTSAPAYCFGKNGYLKLGDDQGHGADIVTPFTNDLRADSLLMVSFRAVAYSDISGVSDAKKFTVNILGGGVFVDTGLTTREVTIGTYTVEGELVAGSMWDASNYLLFIAKTDENPITGNTQIQFIAGDLNTPGANNRVFVDNVYIYTLNEYNDGMIEDNAGTDNDIILGLPDDEE